jgi:hypothetical protein
MFLDQLQVELHLNFDQEHVHNKKVEFDKLKLCTKLNKNKKLNVLPPPIDFESVIIILFHKCRSEQRRGIQESLLCMSKRKN